MIKTVFLFAASVLPGLVYLSMGLFLAFRRREHENSGILKDYVVFLLVLALCYVSGAVAAWAGGDPPASSMFAGHTVLKLYLVSSVLPCVVLHRLVAPARPYVQFYVYLACVTVFMVLMEVLLYSGRKVPSFGILCRGAVTVNFLIFLYILRRVILWLHDKDDGYRRKQLVRESSMHAAILSVYNLLLLLYSFWIHVPVYYFVLVTGFAVIHATAVAAVSHGKTIDAFLFRKQECGEESEAVSGEPSSDAGQDTGILGTPKAARPEKVETDVLSLKERLLGYFESEKPYLSKTISMEEVAMRLYTNKSYLSKTINMEMKKNFRELVNYFRVKEAINIFTSNMEISVSELRDKCGFNNNASFTSAFKLNTGYTPGEWCRDMKQRREKAMNKGK